MKKSKNSIGFTLIELLVIIAIMSILSTIIYASFNTARAKSRDQKRVSDISIIQLALEQYFNRYGQYPTSLNALKPVYIASIPSTSTKPVSGNNYDYNYFPIANISNPTTCISYELWTTFETSNPYLISRNTSGLPSNMQACVSGTSFKNPSDNPLIYDVIPK